MSYRTNTQRHYLYVVSGTRDSMSFLGPSALVSLGENTVGAKNGQEKSGRQKTGCRGLSMGRGCENGRGGRDEPTDKQSHLQNSAAASAQKDPKEGQRVRTPGSLTHCRKEATSGVKCSGHSDSAPAALGNCVFRKGSEE